MQTCWALSNLSFLKIPPCCNTNELNVQWTEFQQSWVLQDWVKRIMWIKSVYIEIISFQLKCISLQEILILNCKFSWSLTKHLCSAKHTRYSPCLWSSDWLHENYFKFHTETIDIQACERTFYGFSTNLNICLGAPCEEQAPYLWLGNLKPWLIHVYPALLLFYDLRRAICLTLQQISKP